MRTHPAPCATNPTGHAGVPRACFAVALVAAIAATASPALALPSLESFALAVGGVSSGGLGGCTTFMSPAPVGAFFNGGVSIPLDGLATCHVNGDFVDVTGATGPLTSTRTVDAAWFDGSFSGTALAHADYGVLSAASHGVFGGSTSSTTVAGAECFGRSNDTFTITSPSVPNGQPGAFRVLVTVTGGLSLTAGGTSDVELNYQFGPSVYTMFRSQVNNVASVPFLNSIYGIGLSGFTAVAGSLSGSGQPTTFAHNVTFGTPFDFKLGLFTYAMPGPGTASTGDSYFDAYISGILVSGPQGQALTDFTVTTGSGATYGPGGLAAVESAPASAADDVRLSAAPNPAASGTRLDFRLPAGVTAKLAVYDASGRLVRQLEDGSAEQGGSRSAWWDGRDDGGAPAPAGTYYARLAWSGGSRTTRVVVVR